MEASYNIPGDDQRAFLLLRLLDTQNLSYSRLLRCYFFVGALQLPEIRLALYPAEQVIDDLLRLNILVDCDEYRLSLIKLMHDLASFVWRHAAAIFVISYLIKYTSRIISFTLLQLFCIVCS